MAVTSQPQGGMPMGSMASSLTGASSGLDYLASVDQLIIKQKVELVEVLTSCEMKNKYEVFNSMQQQAFYAFEESETCNRLFCGSDRGFTIHIQDNYQQEVLTLERPFKCCSGVSIFADGCCKYPINIYDAHQQKIGMMRTTYYCCHPHFGIFDNADNQLYEITGGCCRCQCPCFCRGDVEFPVTSVADGSQVAKVAKQWAGVVREFYTDADTFNVTFPMDLHVTHKALIFASVFLVDMTLYEGEDGSNN